MRTPAGNDRPRDSYGCLSFFTQELNELMKGGEFMTQEKQARITGYGWFLQVDGRLMEFCSDSEAYEYARERQDSEQESEQESSQK